MALTFITETLPLQAGADGVVRVGKTRVTLDSVVGAFSDGATAEEIVQRYPSLSLADVYQVIGYYLRRPLEVDEYLNQQKTRSEAVRVQNEMRFDPQGVRDRLLARCTPKG